MGGWRDDLRASQLRSATPRTSKSQHSGVLLEGQRLTLLRSINVAGTAMEPAKRPLRVKRVTNEVLIFAIGDLILGKMLGIGNCWND